MNIYVVSYQNDARKSRMLQRFNYLSTESEENHFKQMIFTPEVNTNDKRLLLEKINKSDLRVWSIMLQHLDSIRLFLQTTTDKYCLVCEDDIHISKHLNRRITGILKVFESLNLDILLLGYLLPFKIEPGNTHFGLLAEHQNLEYRKYPRDLWGAQMYLINRKHAEYLLNKYTVEYAIFGFVPYNPDWTITKEGNRAILYPMLAVEEGDNLSNDQCQNDFHRRCYQCNINEDFI
jgi:hypothetical protein